MFFAEQNKGQTDAIPAFLRRNSFTPLSSQDQIKRPRLYSVGNPSHTRMSQAPTLPSMQFSEASEGSETVQSEVSAFLTQDTVVIGQLVWLNIQINIIYSYKYLKQTKQSANYVR